MAHRDELLPNKKWNTVARFFAVVAAIVLASFGVLHSGLAQARESTAALVTETKTVSPLTPIPGEAAGEETYKEQESTGSYEMASENAISLQATADVVLKAGMDAGQEVTFAVSARASGGLVTAPVLVYVDVSGVVAGSGLTLADIASRVSVSDSSALGSVGASSDGVHLLWTIVSISGQEATLKFTVPVEGEVDSLPEGMSIAAKTVVNPASGVSSNCGVSSLNGDNFPESSECVATANLQQGGVDAEALGDVTAVVSVSEFSAGSSATVSVDFRNASSEVSIGSGGFVMVDIRGVVSDNVVLDEGSLPEQSSVSEGSITLPLPVLGVSGSGKESGVVSFKVNVSDQAVDVALKPVLVSATLAGSGAVVPCADFGKDSVCSLEGKKNSEKKTTPLNIEVKADGIKTVKVFQGATTEYSVTVKNTGQTAVTTPVTIDIGRVLDSASMEIPPAGQGITVSSEQKKLVWSPPGGFQPQRIAKVTFSVRVNADAAIDNTLTSRVVKTPGSECSDDNPSNASCSATAIVLVDTEGPRPNPVAGKTGLLVKALVNGYSKAAQVQPGQQLRYGVELVNTSDKDITQVRLNENLSQVMPNAHLVEGSLRGLTKNNADEMLVWDGTTIPASETVFLEYRVTVKTAKENPEIWNKQIVSRVVTDSSPAPDGTASENSPAEGKDGSSGCADSNTTDLNCMATATVVEAEPSKGTREAKDPELKAQRSDHR